MLQKKQLWASLPYSKQAAAQLTDQQGNGTRCTNAVLTLYGSEVIKVQRWIHNSTSNRQKWLSKEISKYL